MPKTRKQKEEALERLKASVNNSKSVVISNFTAMTVALDQELRNDFWKNEIEYFVVKKTLLKKYLEESGNDGINLADANGNISIAISSDEVLPAKIIKDFNKKNDILNVIGGFLENNWIDRDKIKELAELPGKDELIAKTIGTIKAPLNGFVNVLSGNLRGLVNVLNAIKEKN